MHTAIYRDTFSLRPFRGGINRTEKDTTAWMPEVEQCREQLPRMRAGLALSPLTPALSRREREKNYTLNPSDQ